MPPGLTSGQRTTPRFDLSMKGHAVCPCRVEQAVQSQRWMRHHMALGLRGQALAEAVQMSIVMELSMREYEAEAQLRTAAQVGH